MTVAKTPPTGISALLPANGKTQTVVSPAPAPKEHANAAPTAPPKTNDPLATLLQSALPDHTLPPLHEAVERADFSPLPASTFAEPTVIFQRVVDELRSAKTILVIGHPPADGDCVGSALGLGRALRALGKDCQIALDFALPGYLRALSRDGEIAEHRVWSSGQPDLVVVLDGGQASRLGRAAEVVARAERVICIDHHNFHITPETLGCKADAEVTTWVRPDVDATALLVAPIVEALGNTPAADAAEPLLCGILTDTGHFTQEGVDERSLRVFKDILLRRRHADLNALTAALRYTPPAAAIETLLSPPRFNALANEPKGEALIQRIQKAHQNGDMVSLSAHDDTWLVQIPHAALDLALAAARLVDAHAETQDLRAYLFDELDAAAAKNNVAILIQQNSHSVSVSVRSRDSGAARLLAESLGGGGHDHSAAALLTDTGLAEVRRKVEAWLKVNAAKKQIALRTHR